MKNGAGAGLNKVILQSHLTTPIPLIGRVSAVSDILGFKGHHFAESAFLALRPSSLASHGVASETTGQESQDSAGKLSEVTSS